MKKFLYYLCGLLLCLGVLILPTAAEEQAPQPEETAAAQEVDPAPSPYADAKTGTYSSEEAKTDAYKQWKKSGMRDYYFWSRGGAKERPAYTRAFRQYYRDDPMIDIVNHMVLFRYQYTDRKGRPYGEPYYELLDYFDTDEAEQNTTVLRIPAKVNDLPVQLYLQHVYKYSTQVSCNGYSNDRVKKVVFEDGVSRIGACAFAQFSALKTVVLPDSMEVIEHLAFENCKSLSKVTGGKALREVQFAAFRGCEKLRTFAPMETVYYIWSEAFKGCGFRSLVLRPDAATSYSGNLGLCSHWGAFENCKKLQTVSFTYSEKGNWDYVGPGTFYGCTALQEVTLQNKCRVLDESAFEGCTKLTTLKNTGRLFNIGSRAFKDCTSLKSFTLAKKCTSFSYDMFFGCTGLEKLVIKDGNKAKLFAKDYDPEKDFAYEVSCNFLPYLPETCTVVVYSKSMKKAVLAREFPGTVRVK